MSWDSYIDNLVAQTKDAAGTAHCDKACIIGLDGGAWTTAGHANAFQVTVQHVLLFSCMLLRENVCYFGEHRLSSLQTRS